MKQTLFIALLIIAHLSYAQNYLDLAKFEYTTTPINSFETEEATTSLTELNGNLTIPIVFSEKFTLLTGVTYEQTTASFAPERDHESLVGITLKLGMNVSHNSKWSGTYMLLPKISSDMKKVGSKDYQIGGAVLMKYTKSEHFNYKFGAYGNTELFGPFLVPIFGFYYLSPSNKFEANVLLPLSVDMNYAVSTSTRFGLNFKGQIRTYNLNTPIGNESSRYLTRSTNELYSYIQYSIKNDINLQFGFGRSIGRSYRMYDEKVSLATSLIYFGDNRNQLNTDFSDSWLFKATVFYRLNLHNQND